MNLDRALPAFEAFPSVLRATVASWSAEEARVRPKQGHWSVVEVCAHVLEEEREDFRPRLLSTLEDPSRPWPPIDPESWVREKNYADRDLARTLDELDEERAESARILRGLGPVDWTLSHHHTTLGELSAGGLLCAWLAHDALHLRQISRSWFRRAVAAAAPFSPRYAGPPEDWWPE